MNSRKSGLVKESGCFKWFFKMRQTFLSTLSSLHISQHPCGEGLLYRNGHFHSVLDKYLLLISTVFLDCLCQWSQRSSQDTWHPDNAAANHFHPAWCLPEASSVHPHPYASWRGVPHALDVDISVWHVGAGYWLIPLEMWAAFEACDWLAGGWALGRRATHLPNRCHWMCGKLPPKIAQRSI